MSLLANLKKYGFVGVTKKILNRAGLYRYIYRNEKNYSNPQNNDFDAIEKGIESLGINIEAYTPSVSSFDSFKQKAYFPVDYHGGVKGSVWDEKLLEHWIAFELLGLNSYQEEEIYIDIAAACSPWVKELRNDLKINAFAIDMGTIGEEFSDLSYYRIENATNTCFDSNSVSGASLQCAYEMFAGNDDINLIKELARILKPGGKAIILPLYMHTHYCSYSSPDFFGKGLSDTDAREYINFEAWNIPTSRKYDATHLKERVLNTIEKLGMKYRLSVLKNKDELGTNIYCHFILEITK